MTNDCRPPATNEAQEIAEWWAAHPYEGRKTVRYDAHVMAKEVLRLRSALSETKQPLTKGELEALIDFHDWNDAGADAMGMVEQAKYHNQRSQHFKALRDALLTANPEKA